MANRVVLEIAGKLEIGKSVSDTVLKRDFVSITQATALLGIAHAQYVRRLVVGGKIASVKCQLEHYAKWFVSRKAIAGYMSSNRRTSTARRFLLRSELKNEKAIRNALSAAGIEYSLELNYQKAVKK